MRFGETIPRLLHLAVSATPDRICATLDEEAVTYRQCEARAACLANALSAWGVGRGDRVLYWADMSLRQIDLFFATSKLGAVFVPANPAFSRGEIDAVADYLEPHALIADPAHQDEAAAAAARIGVRFGVLDGGGRTVAGFDLDRAAERASTQAPPTAPSGDDANVMFLTSGSTGLPKAVVISHRAHWLRSASSPHYDCVSGGRGSGSMFPLYHMAGWLMILQAMGRRRPVHLTRQASAEALWAIVDRHKPQELYGIPAVWRRLLDVKGGDGDCLALALTGTSRVELDLVEAMRRRFPKARNGIFYGSTEMGVSLGAGHDDIDLHPYSVGLPMPGVEARVEDGELLLRSDTAMDGYFRLPDETAEAMQDGWYHSGDLVQADAEGYFEIVGRRKEMIRSGGEWIAPAEVEAAIVQMPGVREAAVVGLPHESWGELVCAVLVVEGSATPDLAAVRAHLAERLAPFKHPRRVEVRREPLPRTGATGQVQRSRVRQDLLAASQPA
jgi:acyl-CoA synthetase (AMP-forming)/AMP-acid ligase II